MRASGDCVKAPRKQRMSKTATLSGQLLAALVDGPGTSGELSIETGISLQICSVVLARLVQRGKVIRSAQMLRLDENQTAHMYYLPEHAP